MMGESLQNVYDLHRLVWNKLISDNLFYLSLVGVH